MLTQGDERRAINIDDASRPCSTKKSAFLRQQINLLFHNLHPMANGDFSKNSDPAAGVAKGSRDA
ncbi:hypothetical protein LQQ74_27340 (plasmid) [Escherichia coli]|nr:hypothetical protein LQQ74_27340 [Escherichia coli]